MLIARWYRWEQQTHGEAVSLLAQRDGHHYKCWRVDSHHYVRWNILSWRIQLKRQAGRRNICFSIIVKYAGFRGNSSTRVDGFEITMDPSYGHSFFTERMELLILSSKPAAGVPAQARLRVRWCTRESGASFHLVWLFFFYFVGSVISFISPPSVMVIWW